MREVHLRLDEKVQVHRVRGELELADCDRHPNMVQTCEVDLLMIGTAGQVELLVNRLNNGFEGSVDSEELFPRSDEPLQC